MTDLERLRSLQADIRAGDTETSVSHKSRDLVGNVHPTFSKKTAWLTTYAGNESTIDVRIPKVLRVSVCTDAHVYLTSFRAMLHDVFLPARFVSFLSNSRSFAFTKHVAVMFRRISFSKRPSKGTCFRSQQLEHCSILIRSFHWSHVNSFTCVDL